MGIKVGDRVTGPDWGGYVVEVAKILPAVGVGKDEIAIFKDGKGFWRTSQLTRLDQDVAKGDTDALGHDIAVR